MTPAAISSRSLASSETWDFDSDAIRSASTKPSNQRVDHVTHVGSKTIWYVCPLRTGPSIQQPIRRIRTRPQLRYAQIGTPDLSWFVRGENFERLR